jgi:regulation of enolase protein 1 (concanavalin A-like superfamily)
MKKAILMTALAGLWSVTAARAEVLFQDDFKGKLGTGWSWVREDPTAWRVTEQGLEIRALPGNMWGGANNAKNVLVREVPLKTGDQIEVTVTVTNQPTEQYEQTDLVWYYDDSHMVKIGQELVNGKLSLVMGREEGDKTRTIAILPVELRALELRFQVSANGIRGLFRAVGDEAWREAGVCSLPVHGDPKVSFQVYQGTTKAEHWARFNGLRIEKRRAGAQ